jgi:hypothetical protein
MGGGSRISRAIPAGYRSGPPAVAAAVRETMPDASGMVEAMTASVRLREGSVKGEQEGAPFRSCRILSSPANLRIP